MVSAGRTVADRAMRWNVAPAKVNRSTADIMYVPRLLPARA